jgi:HEAT repeat protein
MAVDISGYVSQLSGELSDNAYEASNALGRIGSEAVVKAMIELLIHPHAESRYMAARTLELVENNKKALEPLLIAIQASENRNQAGDLMSALEGFNVGANYVEIFKLYLFGSFKVSLIAKDLLDHKEFDITARTIRKAQKHWDHYSNNVKQDDLYTLRKLEVEEMLIDLKKHVGIE